MDRDAVEAILKDAAEQAWPYPRLFEALKAAGVERYEVNVLHQETTYVGGQTSFLKHADHPQPLVLGPAYNLPALQDAIRQTQAGQLPYPQFLERLAAAGVPFYRVDMKPRTVTYHTTDKRKKHVEAVPPVQA